MNPEPNVTPETSGSAAQTGPRPPRRRVLGAGVLTLAVAGGVAGGLLRPRSPSATGRDRDASPTRSGAAAHPEPAPWLLAAVQREQALIGSLRTAGSAQPSLVPRLRPALDDHTAHLAALLSLPGAPVPTPADATPATSLPPSAGAPGSAAPLVPLSTLAAAETAAAQAAATQSAEQMGTSAVLLASISACESTHAQWLS
jgi:hypothetical protein